MNHKLDTDTHVYFYEQDFYVLSNFSSFRVYIDDIDFMTSEHAYHYFKFEDNPNIAFDIIHARSAHDAFKIAESYKEFRRSDWDDVKIGIMSKILLAKVRQHEYVYRKLMETGNRILVEDSWRDSVWGWGEDQQGQNLLGNLWMEIREYLRVV